MTQLLKIAALIVFTSILLVGLSCRSEMDRSGEQVSVQVQEEEGFPLIYHMSFMSRYTKKLWFSGMEENWDLADIYSHEIEEIAEDIVEGNYADDEISISDLMQAMMMPQIEQVEEAIDLRDREMFEQRYRTFIQTCNQCHDASNYSAVQVTVPTMNPFNQNFSVRTGM